MPIQRREIEAHVSVERTKHGEPMEPRAEKTVPIGEVLEVKPLCNVGMRVGRKFNLGNYESLDIQVSLNAPCEQADVDEAMDAVKAWVYERLERVVEELGVGEKK